MIVQTNFLTKLKDFGLNSYESKIWTALLSRGVSTAGELSDIANVPRSRSYDVLESLEKKGFVAMKPGKPIKYVVVPPEEVIERIKKKVKEKSEKQIELMNKLRSKQVIDELNALYEQGIDLVEPSEITGSIKGRSNLYNHLESMIKNAKESVIISTTANGLERKNNALKNVISKVKQKGIKVRIAAPTTKENSKIVREVSKIAEIKNLNLKLRFCIIDTREILFMYLDDEKVHPSYDSGIWVNAEFFAKALESAFDKEWQK
jgi:sugar-specific transcriptional regulator TrmB